MSTKSGANVLRYSALGLGVFYGFYHQRTISASQRAAAAQREYEHQQELIKKAKEAYAKQKQPAAAATANPSATTGLDQDPMSPNFDLEAFVEALMKAK